MANAPVKLSVHRNTRDQRNRKVIRNDMKAAVASAQRQIAPTGYALVAWNDEQYACAYWAGGPLPTSVVPEFVAATIRRKLGMLDAEDVIRGPDDTDGAS